MKTVVKSDIVDALRSVGLQRGDSVMVHTSLGKIGYVCGGAQVVIEALIESVGEEGTIMMPTQSWKNYSRRKCHVIFTAVNNSG